MVDADVYVAVQLSHRVTWVPGARFKSETQQEQLYDMRWLSTYVVLMHVFGKPWKLLWKRASRRIFKIPSKRRRLAEFLINVLIRKVFLIQSPWNCFPPKHFLWLFQKVFSSFFIPRLVLVQEFFSPPRTLFLNFDINASLACKSLNNIKKHRKPRQSLPRGRVGFLRSLISSKSTSNGWRLNLITLTPTQLFHQLRNLILVFYYPTTTPWINSQFIVAFAAANRTATKMIRKRSVEWNYESNNSDDLLHFNKIIDVVSLTATSVSVSAWTLVAISVERYYAICHPLRSRRWQTLKHAYKLIFLIWFLSLLFMLPIAALSKLIPLSQGNDEASPSHFREDCLATPFSRSLRSEAQMPGSLADWSAAVRENLQHLFGFDSAGGAADCFGCRLSDDLSDALAVDGLGEAAGEAHK